MAGRVEDHRAIAAIGEELVVVRVDGGEASIRARSDRVSVTIADRWQKSSVPAGREAEREADISSRRDGGERIFERSTVEIERLVEDPRVRRDAELEEVVDNSRDGIESGYTDLTGEIRGGVTNINDDPTVGDKEELEHRTARERDELDITVGDLTAQRNQEVEDPTAGEWPGRERRERRVSSRLTGYLWSINREEASEKRGARKEDRK